MWRIATLLGMRWNGQFYVDLALPFGLCSNPFILNQFAVGWHWILTRNHEVRFLLHYLDDFLTTRALSSNECHRNLCTTQAVANNLGIPLPDGEVNGPSNGDLPWDRTQYPPAHRSSPSRESCSTS